LALHLLVGAAFSGSRVPSLTKTDLEDSISGYGQEFFTLPKAKKSVNAFLGAFSSARRPPDKWKKQWLGCDQRSYSNSPTPVIPSPDLWGRRISAVLLSAAGHRQTAELLRGVYPEPTAEILLPRLRDQNDGRRAQDDSEWAEHDGVRARYEVHSLDEGDFKVRWRPLKIFMLVGLD
jgi:hypothetical protein